ncbi:hypothetical protein GCM10022281_24650 [Sphingomonas rosea]|jgi:hypothetical protein|uniref:Glycine zipper family protein n=1 Tax=Sphingomonas rosea TaxID=335605 RepID=A0ABP7UFW8_9SPHN
MAAQQDKPLYAGGCLLFVGFLVGAAIGIAVDQPSIGTMIGVAVGAGIAVLLWVMRRQR